MRYEYIKENTQRYLSQTLLANFYAISITHPVGFFKMFLLFFCLCMNHIIHAVCVTPSVKMPNLDQNQFSLTGLMGRKYTVLPSLRDRPLTSGPTGAFQLPGGISHRGGGRGEQSSEDGQRKSVSRGTSLTSAKGSAFDGVDGLDQSSIRLLRFSPWQRHKGNKRCG